MRKEFSSSIEKLARENKKILFLTGDLGFMALENVREAIGDRFINAGVSEQNMITMSSALASEGFLPICYSIAPFTVFRPAEQIRLDICLHNMNVKIVGNGGGYGYGIMGSTHHAIEDVAVLSSFQGMVCYIPFCNEDVPEVTQKMIKTEGPAYLRLGYGIKPENIVIPPYSHTRRLAKGNELTIVGMGTVILNALEVLEDTKADVFVISEIPIPGLSNDLIKSLEKTKKLLVLEEHVSRGGLAENLSIMLLEKSVLCIVKHLYAVGYPNGLYGSQKYHQKVSSLDPESVKATIKEMINE
jgi:transketolase